MDWVSIMVPSIMQSCKSPRVFNHVTIFISGHFPTLYILVAVLSKKTNHFDNLIGTSLLKVF